MQWAIDQGVADPDNICIFGGSYGDYTSIRCLNVQSFTYRIFQMGLCSYAQCLQFWRHFR